MRLQWMDQGRKHNAGLSYLEDKYLPFNGDAHQGRIDCIGRKVYIIAFITKDKIKMRIV